MLQHSTDNLTRLRLSNIDLSDPWLPDTEYLMSGNE
jgi:hypothetical protein